jgi:uroporphyrinogen-III synthase
MSNLIYLLSPLVKEDTISLPMIRFQTVVKEVDLSDCDVLMFTSKQAVKSIDQLNPEWKKIPSLAIGSATAMQIEKLGGKVLYQPNSFYGKTLSEDIIEKFHDKRILYLRPKEVSFDSKSFLASSGIRLDEQIIYETICIDYQADAAPIKDAIIIFTSPSTIQCFLKNFTWDESYTAVVIGEATKEHLPKNAHYVVADIPRIDACISKAKNILITSNSK